MLFGPLENSQQLIFCVEDDPDDQSIITGCLAKIRPQYKINFAENGLDAIHKLRSLPIKPVCIFIDINMPVISGFQFLAMVKADRTLDDIPCIIVSTSVNPKDRQYAKKLGADGYIIKPSNSHTFSIVLEEHIQKAEAREISN